MVEPSGSVIWLPMSATATAFGRLACEQSNFGPEGAVGPSEGVFGRVGCRIGHDDVGIVVAVQVGKGHCIARWPWDRTRRLEGSISVAQEDLNLSRILARHDQVGMAVVVHVGDADRGARVRQVARQGDHLFLLECPIPAPEQNGDVAVWAVDRVSNRDVGDAVAVQVAHGDRGRAGGGIEAALRLECAVAAAQKHRDVARIVVRDHDVWEAVAVEIRDRERSPEIGEAPRLRPRRLQRTNRLRTGEAPEMSRRRCPAIR